MAEGGSHSALGAGRVKPIRARATGEEALTQRSQGKETRPGQVRVPFWAPPPSCAFSVPHTVTSPVNGPQLLLAGCRVIVCVPHLPRGLCSSPPIIPRSPASPPRAAQGAPPDPFHCFPRLLSKPHPSWSQQETDGTCNRLSGRILAEGLLTGVRAGLGRQQGWWHPRNRPSRVAQAQRGLELPSLCV